MKYHKIPESSIQAELELDWDFLEHSRTYQLFGIIWNSFSQGHIAIPIYSGKNPRLWYTVTQFIWPVQKGKYTHAVDHPVIQPQVHLASTLGNSAYCYTQ